MGACVFCSLVANPANAAIVYEDSDLLAFLDVAPIREAHTQIIPKTHIPTFELLPPELASRIVILGQQLAGRMKEVYEVDRVAFVFTGGDVPHAHAHVVPMVEKTDITSARYITAPSEVTWGSRHLRSDLSSLLKVRDRLNFKPQG